MKYFAKLQSSSVYVLWFCIGLLAFTLAILPLSYSYISIRIPINCLYITLALFILFFYRDVKYLSRIWFVLVCMCFVVIMAYVSLLYAEYVLESKKAISQYLLEPTLFMFLGFLLTLRLKKHQLEVFFILLCVALFYHPLATIYDFYANGGAQLDYRAKLPSYHTPATGYSFYLLFALSFSYMGFLKTKGIFKLIFAFFVVMGVWAFVCNGGRFALLACVAILCAPFVCFSYRYKKYILTLVCLSFVGGGIGLYHASSSWDSRYNLYNTLNTFNEVWHTPPAAMGQYLGDGCLVWVKCSVHSMGKTSPIVWEYSSLDRLSKLKSTFLAILDNPWRPNGYHFQQFPFNIQHIFPLSSLNHPFSLEENWRGRVISAHVHNHNYILSVWFELGLVGFVAFALFVGYFPYMLYREKIDFASNVNIRQIFLGSIGLALIGLVLANIFDCFPVRDGQLFLFVLLGVFLGIKYGDKNAI